VASQVTYILRFFPSRNIRIARTDRAWDQTVASWGKGSRFLADICRRTEESAFPVFKFQAESVRKQAVVVKPAGMFSDLEDDAVILTWIVLLYPGQVFPFVGFVISACFKSGYGPVSPSAREYPALSFPAVFDIAGSYSILKHRR
jgi:hypothetical protein